MTIEHGNIHTNQSIQTLQKDNSAQNNSQWKNISIMKLSLAIEKEQEQANQEAN
jgi:hypothetical protein